MPRPPKYITKKQTPPKESTEPGWLLFLESRKESGQKQFLRVLSILLEKENDYDDGWVPISVIEGCVKTECPMSRSRLDHLLNDMEKYHIVNNKTGKVSSASTPNQNRTFYRYNPLALCKTYTKEGIKKDHSRLFRENLDLSIKLVFAETVLHRHGLLQEYQDELKTLEDKREKNG
jgi:hypothetical protein